MNIIPDILLYSLSLNDGDIVADFGSGVGHYTHKISDAIAPSGHLFAIDIDEDALKTSYNMACQVGCERCVSYICCDLENEQIQCYPRSVDYVLIVTLLFQTEKKENIFREAFRILKDGGTVVVVDWKDSFGGIGPVNEDIFSKADAWKMSLDTGFKDIKPVDVGHYHYGITGIRI